MMFPKPPSALIALLPPDALSHSLAKTARYGNIGNTLRTTSMTVFRLSRHQLDAHCFARRGLSFRYV